MRSVMVVVLVGLVLFMPTAALAYRWQLTPGCDSLDLAFAPLSPHLFVVSGTQDYRACGIGDLIPGKPVIGLAVVDGADVTLSVAIGFTIGIPGQPLFFPTDMVIILDANRRGSWRLLGTTQGGLFEPVE